MLALNVLTRRQRLAVLFAVCAAVFSVVSATLLAFAADGDTEWIAADSDLMLAARRCDKAASASQRHACLREVAQAQRATNGAPTQLAKH